jgi:hypothetical protein
LDPYTDAEPESQVVSFPSLGRWLDATRQKGGLRGVAKMEVPDVWMEKTAEGTRVLNINVKITNLAADESLDFRGWSGGDGVTAMSALLADEQGEMLEPLHSGRSDRGDRAASRRVDPNESCTERLRFSLAESTSSSFRLALPYAVIGHTGHLGFEIPLLMIQDHPPDEKPPAGSPEALGSTGDDGPDSDAAADEPTRAVDGPGDSATSDAPNDATGNRESAGGQPATFKDLQRSIDNEAAPVTGGASDGPQP